MGEVLGVWENVWGECGKLCGGVGGLPVTSPHGNFASLSYIENLHCLHRNNTLNSQLW